MNAGPSSVTLAVGEEASVEAHRTRTLSKKLIALVERQNSDTVFANVSA